MDPPHPIIEQLCGIVGDDNVLWQRDELVVYECDGFPVARGMPMAVVFPTETHQVAACAHRISNHGLQIIARGSGTGLAGGGVAFDRGVIVCTSRMRRIEKIDLANRAACVQAGVCNTALSEAVAAEAERLATAAYYFAPDPSSQRASTIGGNAATNAGGISTLKRGVTVSHILGIEAVLADGTITRTRFEPLHDSIGPDLPALWCGSEGTLGIITRLWCRLVPRPVNLRTLYAVFNSLRDACEVVSDTIAAGIVPASMEMMDQRMIEVVEDAFGFGFPAEAGALLLIELDGPEAIIDAQLERIAAIARGHGAGEIEQCADPARRAQLWSARKRAFGAIGRISHSYCTQDACIPRSMLPDAIERIGQIGREFGLTITNVFHAGDGNVHPILLFDDADPVQVQNVLRAGEAILRYCISIGGTITGEHGVGVEKIDMMPEMFNADTLDAFTRVRKAFDPAGSANEGKLVPSDRLRIELLKPASPKSPGGAMVH